MEQKFKSNRLGRLINHINCIEQDETKLIDLLNEREHYTRTDWDYVTEHIYIPVIIANHFILKKDEIIKHKNIRPGIDFLIVLYEQEYSEDFLNKLM